MQDKVMRIGVLHPAKGGSKLPPRGFQANPSAVQLRGQEAQAAQNALCRAFAEQDIIREVAVSQEVHACGHREKVALGKGQAQTFRAKILYRAGNFIQAALVIMDEAKIITIADIILDFQHILHKAVKFIQVEISEPLA